MVTFSGTGAAAGEATEGDGAGEGEGAERPEEGEEGADPHRSDGEERRSHLCRPWGNQVLMLPH